MRSVSQITPVVCAAIIYALIAIQGEQNATLMFIPAGIFELSQGLEWN